MWVKQNMAINLLQESSSELSGQSNSPLQSFQNGIQVPSPHRCPENFEKNQKTKIFHYFEN